MDKTYQKNNKAIFKLIRVRYISLIISHIIQVSFNSNKLLQNNFVPEYNCQYCMSSQFLWHVSKKWYAEH